MLDLLLFFFNKKWFIDRLQNEFIASTLLKVGYGITYKIVDKGLLEFFGPFGTSSVVSNTSKYVSLLESGKINHYAFLMFVFLVVFISVNLLFRYVNVYIDFHIFFIFVFYILINKLYLL